MLRARKVAALPDYVCENCGMLIKTGHGHTREECEEYNMHYITAPEGIRKRPLYPDHRCKSPTVGRVSRTKITAPYYYYETGTFKNLEVDTIQDH